MCRSQVAYSTFPGKFPLDLVTVTHATGGCRVYCQSLRVEKCVRVSQSSCVFYISWQISNVLGHSDTHDVCVCVCVFVCVWGGYVCVCVCVCV